MRRLCSSLFAAGLIATCLFADLIPVRHLEGLIRGFLVLRDLNNNILATGDLSQFTTGNTVTNELVFHFKDGSIHDETYVFSQQHSFQLVTYHLLQKGPAFKHMTDMSVNAASGDVNVRYTEDSKEKTASEHMTLPADVANGLVVTLLNDIDPKVPKTTVSMVASTPKPRLVKLDIYSAGEDSFSIAGSPRKAARYVIKVNIGGIAGVVAPIVGKQPPDTSVWIIQGKAPGFVRSEGPLYDGGPVWRIELASPTWPKQ